MRYDLAVRVLEKAMNGELRSIYYEPLGPFPCEAHKALVDALAAYGPSKMVLLPDNPARYSQHIRQAAEWEPDLVIFGYLGKLDFSDLDYLRQRCPDVFVVN